MFSIAYFTSYSVDSAAPLIPAVVINLRDSAVSLDQLETGFQRFADGDDVFSMEFIDGALIYVQAADS